MADPRCLRLWLVTETFPPEINGVAMTLRRLVEALAQRHRVTVVRPRQAGDPDGDVIERPEGWTERLRPGFLIKRAGFRLGFPSGGFLRRAWRAERPDVVHIATEGPLGWSALRAAERLGLPVTSSFHTNFHDYSRYYGLGAMHGWVASYLRGFHNWTLRTLVPSRDLLDALAADGYRNLAMFGRGVDTRLFDPARRDHALRRSWGANERTLVLLHVGRVAPEKNMPLAFAATARIRAAIPDSRLVVVGDGPMREAYSQQLGPQGGAVFTGALVGPELARAYASADLFLFPSMSETFGNVALEAMASGVPPVAFDYAAPQRYVRHAWNGWLAPFGDERSWLSLAEGAAASRRTLEAFGERARQAAIDVPWSTVFAQFEGELLGAVREHAFPPRSGAGAPLAREAHALAGMLDAPTAGAAATEGARPSA